MPPHVMDVRLRSIHQLFNSMDPSPFVDRDLDADAEEYIVSWARELPRHGEFRLNLHLEESPEDPEAETKTEAAVRHYFGYQAEVTAREFTALMREGRLSLVIGLLFLATCMLTGRLITNLLPDQTIAELASEGLLVGGWVSMWRPMEIFLYKWWPLARRRSILQRLGRMEVRLKKAWG